MMVIVALAVGVLVGWLLNWASDVLPRFAAVDAPAAPLGSPRTRPALWDAATGAADPRWGLPLAVELGTALCFAGVWLRLGPVPEALLLVGAFCFFLLVAVIDFKYRLVLNVMIYPALVITAVGQIVLAPGNLLPVILGGGMAFMIFYATALLRPGDLGGGDVKLAALIGLLFGFPGVLWALLVGAGAGAAVSVYLLLFRREGRKQTIAYAPFLCLGAVVVLFLAVVI